MRQDGNWPCVHCPEALAFCSDWQDGSTTARRTGGGGRNMRFQDLGCGYGRRAGGRNDAAAGSTVGHGKVAEWLVEVGLDIVHEVRGPMRLWDFAERLKQRLGMPPVPPGRLCDA